MKFAHLKSAPARSGRLDLAPAALLAAILLIAPACTSTPPGESGSGVTAAGDAEQAPAPKGPAYLLRYVEYRPGVRLELVNPSHTTPVDQYSKVRADAARKVTSEEWMDELVKFLRKQGWEEEARSGPAPSGAQSSCKWALELVGPGGTTHVVQPLSTQGDSLERLRVLRAAFLDTYNATPGFQTVQTESGKLPFKQPNYDKKSRQ